MALLQEAEVFKQRQVARRRAISQTGGHRYVGAKSPQSSMRRGGNCSNVTNYLSQKGQMVVTSTPWGRMHQEKQRNTASGDKAS